MKFSELKELYNKYGSMSFTISGKTQTLKHFFGVICDDNGLNPFEEFASYVEGVIENGIDESNELELVTTVFLSYLEFEFALYDDDEIVTIEFNGEVVLSKPIKEVYQ